MLARLLLLCVIPILAVRVSAVQISLLATNISLPAPWSYYTGGDSPEGSWAAPWTIQSSVSATVALGQVLAPGDYSVYFKILDYNQGNSNYFTLGGVTSALQVFNDGDATTGYWSTNLTVTTSSSASNIVVNFFRPATPIPNLLFMAMYVTSFTNEIVLRDDRALTFAYPANYVALTNKGNIIPNSSFETGIDSFWRYSTGGRTNHTADLWDTNVAFHGSASLRIPNTDAQNLFNSNPFLVSSNRPHTISVYVRTTNGTSSAWLFVRSVYTAPPGLPAVYETPPTNGITATNGWARISLSITNLPWYPVGEYYVQLQTQNISGGDYVFFDGLQIEEGDLTAYAPKEPFEFALVASEPSRVFWSNANTNTLTVKAFNNSGAGLTRKIDYKIRNNLNATVDSGSVTMTAGAGAVALSTPITLNTNLLGSFRAEFSITNSTIGNEVTYVMTTMPTAGFVDDSNIGGHINPLSFTADTAARLGVKWNRTLSLGSGLARWSVVEPSQGAFSYGTGVNLLTNAGLTVMGVLGENLPSWMTGNQFFRTTNVVGSFAIDEALASATATGRVSYVMYSTNGPGTALQATNMSGLFTTGSVTGLTSGATATILGSVFPNTIDWRRYTNYLANIFAQYSGTITNWEVWNEPDQDAIEMPYETGTVGPLYSYAEACRLAAHWANIINPNIRLMFGGGVSSPTVLSNIWDRLGPYTNFHAWTIHLYPGNEGDFSSVITAYGKPIWNTETGMTDKGGLTGSRSSWRRAGKYVIGWRSGENMYSTLWENIRSLAVNFLTCIGYRQSKYFYYDVGVRNLGTADFDSPQYTVWDYDDSIRAKGAWLSAMGGLLGTASGQGRLTLNDASATAFLFLRGSTPLISFWASTNKTITLAGNVTTSDFKIVDMMGNRSTPGNLIVTFGRMPLLLEAVGALSQSNLTYAVTNGVVAGRTDTTAPTLAIVEHPHTTPNEWAAFRWVAIDELSMPSYLHQDALLYSYRINSETWSDWAADTFILADVDGALSSFSVKAKDTAGNESSETVIINLIAAESQTAKQRMDGNVTLQGNVRF